MSKLNVKSVIIGLSNSIKDGYTTFRYRRKIKKSLEGGKRKRLTFSQKKMIKDYYGNHGLKNVNIDWHNFFYSINGMFSEKYIPEDLYYTRIEPFLNRIKDFRGLLDKNLLSVLFENIKQPVTILKNKNGYYYSRNNTLMSRIEAINLCLKHECFVIKPSLESGGGKNVSLITTENSAQVQNLFDKYKKDFILQEVVSQNSHLKLLNASSLNTIRILSYFNESEVIILSSLVRIGRLNMFTDNSSSGGISCNIKDNGKLNKFGFDSSGRKYFKSDSETILDEFQIPYFENIVDTVRELHKNMPYFRVVSWDMAINSEDDILLLEYNTAFQEINFHQINNGPLFGNFTSEILDEMSLSE